MVEFDNCFNNLESIDINDLLNDIDLPVRIKNILKSNCFYSKDAFYQMVDKLVLDHTSNYIFPNRLISFYPQVLEKQASSDIMCHLSGAVIKKGSLYYTYHPFMEDLKTGRVYTIKKKINAELGYIDCFPQNLFTYEEWYYKLKNAYFQSEDSIIDFYSLSVNCGYNCLEPYMLGKSKIKRKK